MIKVARGGRMVQLLRSMEWSASKVLPTGETIYGAHCPMCKAWKKHGHFDYCELGQMLINCPDGEQETSDDSDSD